MSEPARPDAPMYVYDHEFDPVMSGQWKTTACTRCEHRVSSHWSMGVATASAIGGRPEDYLTPIDSNDDMPACLVCAVTGPLHKRDRHRIKHAVAQIDHALTDSRIDGAAAAWLRTIRSGLTGADDAD